MWSVVNRDGGRCDWGDVGVDECYVLGVTCSDFKSLCFCSVISLGEEGFNVGGDVCVAYVFVYQGDEPTAVTIGPVLSYGGVVSECWCFLSASEFSFLDECNMNVVVLYKVFQLNFFGLSKPIDVELENVYVVCSVYVWYCCTGWW